MRVNHPRAAMRLALGGAVVGLGMAAAACGSNPSSSSAGQVTGNSSRSSSSSSPSSVSSSASVDVTNFAGTFNGTWNNTTFGSTGAAKAAVTPDAAQGIVKIVLTLGGNVFGGAAPAPETFIAGLNVNGVQGSGTSPTFGPWTLTISTAGTLDFTSTPTGRVIGFKAHGTITSSGINLTYNLNLSDGSTATGTITLTK
jgi:hypothetical protein